MSIVTDAQVTILIADYAANDAGGKLNLIGGNARFLGQQPHGASAPFCLIVQAAVPVKHAGSDFALTIEIHDVTVGKILSLPSQDGTLQPLRAQQVVTVDPLNLPPGVMRPADAFVTPTVVMQFADGLPLTPGHSFEAKVQIDGQSRHWFYRFHAMGAQPGPVFGGPANPSQIPGVGEYVVDVPDPGIEGPEEDGPERGVGNS